MDSSSTHVEPNPAMSEPTWYARFAIWVGAVVLLVQAVAGRDAGPMSLVAVVLMGGGLAVFLASLWRDEHGRTAELVPPVEGAATEPPAHEPPPAEPKAKVSVADSLVPDETARPEVAAEPVEAQPPPIEEPTAPPSLVAAPHAGPTALVETYFVPHGMLDDVACVFCDRPFTHGQLVATCPVCGRPQHGACWVENGFRCAAPDCTGAGSLQAPGSGPTGR